MKNIKKHWILLSLVTVSACYRKSLFKQNMTKGTDLVPIGKILANSTDAETSMLWNDTATIANPQSASVNGSNCYIYGRKADISLSMRCTDQDLHKSEDRWIASNSIFYKEISPFIALTGVNKGKVLVMERATGDGLNSVIHIYKVNGDKIVETGTYKPDFTDRISLISGDYSLIGDNIFVSFTICGIEGRCLRYFKISNNEDGTDSIEETYRYKAEKLDDTKYGSNLLFLPKTNRLILSHATNRFQGDEKSFLNIYETAGSEQIIKKILASNIPLSDFTEGSQIVQALVMNNKNSTFALCYSNHLSDKNDNDKEGVYATLFSHSIEAPAEKINEVKISDDTEDLIVTESAVQLKEHKLNKAIYVEDLNTWFFSYSMREAKNSKNRRTFVRAYREGIDGLVPLTGSIEADRDGKEFFEHDDDKSDMYYRDGKLVVIRACKTLNAPVGEQDGVCETVFNVEVKKTFTSTTMKLTTKSSTTTPFTTTTSTSTTTTTSKITDAPTTTVIKATSTNTPVPVTTIKNTKAPKTTKDITTLKPTISTLPVITEEPTETNAPVTQQTISDGKDDKNANSGLVIGAAAGTSVGILGLGAGAAIAYSRNKNNQVNPNDSTRSSIPFNQSASPSNDLSGRRPNKVANYDVGNIDYIGPEYAVPGPGNIHYDNAEDNIEPTVYDGDSAVSTDRTYLQPVSTQTGRPPVSAPAPTENYFYEKPVPLKNRSSASNPSYNENENNPEVLAMYSTVNTAKKTNKKKEDMDLYDAPRGPNNSINPVYEYDSSTAEQPTYSTVEDVYIPVNNSSNPSDNLYAVPTEQQGGHSESIITAGSHGTNSIVEMDGEETYEGFDMPNEGYIGFVPGEEEFDGFGEAVGGYLSVEADGSIKPVSDASTNA